MTDLKGLGIRPEFEIERITDLWGETKVHRFFICRYPMCREKFNSKREHDRHNFIKHYCDQCKIFCHDIAHHSHIQIGAGIRSLPKSHRFYTGKFELVESVYDNVLLTFETEFDQDLILASASEAFDFVALDLESIMRQALSVHKNIRISATLSVTLTTKDESERKDVDLFTPFNRIFSTQYIIPTIVAFSEYIAVSLSVYCDGKSGYKLVSIDAMNIRISKFKPIKTTGFIPVVGLAKRHFVNIKGNDSLCFVRAVLFGVKQNLIRLPDKPDKSYDELDKNGKRRLKRKFENPSTYCDFITECCATNEINFSDCMNGVTLEQIDAFENINPSISITVFANEGPDIYVIRPTLKVRQHHIDLLMVKKTNVASHEQLPSHHSELQTETHFCNIININSLSRKARHGARAETCQYCFNCFFDGSLEKHEKVCAVHCGKVITFPTGDFYEFKHTKLYEAVPYKIYFTFQYLPTLNPIELEQTAKDPLLYTTPLANLAVAGYALCVLGPHNKVENQLVHESSFVGPNPIEHFLTTLFALSDKIERMVRSLKLPLTMNLEDNLKYLMATNCGICKQSFKGKTKCRDHSKITGRYREALCQQCNILVRLQTKPVAIGLGIRNKELNSILSSLKSEWTKKARIVCKSKNEIMSLTLRGIKFVDLQSFLNTDFDSLVQRQKKGTVLEEYHIKFPSLYQGFCGKEYIFLLTQKLWFPQMFFINAQEFENSSFPSVDFMVDPVTLEKASLEEWGLAHDVYEKMGCNNFLDYIKLNMKRKVLLLADIAKTFQEFCMSKLKLDPLSCFSLSTYAWAVCTSEMTDAFQFIKDINIINFINGSIKGPICETVCRHLKANCERLRCYNNNYERTHILTADAVGLYPSVLMNSYLPFSDFEFVGEKELNAIDIQNFDECGTTGYLMCVDLVYNKDHFQRDSDLPLAPTRKEIPLYLLSNQQKSAFSELYTNAQDAPTKIVCDFFDKNDYVCDIVYLKFLLSKGMILKKRKSALKYTQKQWLKYVFAKLFDLRAAAKQRGDEIGYLLLKQICNRIFGVMLSSTDKYFNTYICTSKVDAEAYLSRHSFIDYKILNPMEGISLFFMRRQTVRYSMPCAASLVALDRSKLELYKFWYTLKEMFPGVKLGYVDTDQVICQVPDPNNNYIQKLDSLRHILDFSELNFNDELFSLENSNKPGCWRLECFNAIEFLSLRPKLYSIKLKCNVCANDFGIEFCPSCQWKKTASGIPKHVKKTIPHAYYMESIYGNSKDDPFETNVLVSKGNEFSVQTKKLSVFNSLTTTRILLDNNIDSIPFGLDREIPRLIPINKWTRNF